MFQIKRPLGCGICTGQAHWLANRRMEVTKNNAASIISEANEVAVAETYFAERAERGDINKAKKILTRVGKNNPLIAGDEI